MAIGSSSSTVGSTGIPFSQTGSLNANQVLVFDTVTQAFINSSLPAGGNTGEINTASNVGSGTEVFKDKLLGDLRFRTLIAGTGINLSSTATEITVASTGAGTGDITNGINTGAGANVFRDKNVADLRYRTLTAGTNVTITQNVDDITIAAGTNATTLNSIADTGYVKVANNLSDVTAASARTNLAISSTAEADLKYIHLDTSKAPTADATTSLGTGVKRFNEIYAVSFKGNADTATTATTLAGFAPGDYVALTGSTMTGALTLSGAPTNALHAATKGYVDTSVADAIDTAPGALDTLNELAAALGDDANFSTTVTNSIATKLPLAGGTLTGALVLSGAPTIALHSATKSYVDTQDALQLTAASNLSDLANATTARTNLGLGTAATTAATAYLAAGTTTAGIAEGANLYYTDARWDTRLIAKTTDNLTEGSSNLYFTNARADARITAADTDALSEGSTNLYFTNARADARADARITAADTGDLSEGSNLYYTNARADARIGAASVGDVSNVDLTGITNGQFLKWDGGNSKFVASNVTEENLSNNTTDDLAEGSNLYFTTARAKAAAVADTINDSTVDIAPSQNAVFDALALKEGALAAGTTAQYYKGNKTWATLDTAAVAENTNLYFTTARAKAATVADTISNGTVDVAPSQNAVFDALALKEDALSAGSSTQYYRGDKSFQTLDTSIVAEGSNLYYTDARADARVTAGFSAKSTTNLSEGTNLYYTDARFDTRLAAKTTANLPEGANLYFTNARVDTRLGAVSAGLLSDIDLTGIANGQYLKWNGTKFIAQTITQEDLSNNDTDDIAEGSTNLYYTDARANARVAAATGVNLDLSSKTTANLAEVTNLYYTQARFDSALTAKSTTNLSEGTNLYFTDARANSAFDTRLATKTTANLAENTNLYYTDARARASISVAGDLSYNSGTGVITYDGPNAVGDLSDVTITAAASNEVLMYNGTAWVDTALTTAHVAEGANLYYTDARFDTRLAAKTTANLPEGANLYFTDARVDARLGSITIGSMSDVDITGITTGQFLKWNGTTLVPSDVTEENLSNNTTTDLAEGTNLYFTNARADARVTAAVGASVQAYDADLTAIGALAKADGNIIVGNGSTWVAESGSTARTSLGLGTMSEKDATLYYDKADTDGRFANVLGTGANLADIADVAIARTNLGLGSAATQESVAFADTGLSNLPDFAVARANLGAMSITEGDARFVNIDESWEPAVDNTIVLGDSTKRFNTIYARQIIGKFVGEFGAGVNTDAMPEGSSNLYFTNARADARADVRIAASPITTLSDVTITTPANNQVLKYNGSAWVNGSFTLGINELTDVDTVTLAPANGEGLVWQSSGSKWVPNAVLKPGDIATAPGAGQAIISFSAVAATEVPTFQRTITSDSVGAGLVSSGVKTTDMADGFGSGLNITIKDNAGVTNYIGGYYAKRAGADNTGALCMYTTQAGTPFVAMELSSTGAATFAGAFTLPVVDGTAGQVLSTNGSGVVGWSTVSGGSGGDITAVNAGTGLTGGGLSGDVTLAVDVGTAAGKIVQLDGSAKLPAVDGSQLTNIAHTPAGYNNANWDTAFGWGDHASGGYLTSVAADSINDTHIDWGTGANQVSTADIPENTNLYYTDARADARVNAGFAAKSTTDLSEGSNLYYTDVRADARITNAGSANWNTAFGWGNHASGGYLTSETFTSVVQDTTPQLGGDLDGNSKAVTNVKRLEIVDSAHTGSSLDISNGAVTGGVQRTYVLNGSTGNNTQTEIFVGAQASTRMAVSNNNAWMFDVDIIAVNAGNNEQAGWKYSGMIHNFGGTTSLTSNLGEVEVDPQTNWSVDVSADNTNDALVVKVTGENSKTIKWVAFVKTTQLS